VSITPDDPRQVGGRYWCGYWGHEYTVIAIHDFDDWRGRSITVRWEEPCVWHPPPCVHAHTVTHSTPRDAQHTVGVGPRSGSGRAAAVRRPRRLRVHQAASGAAVPLVMTMGFGSD
jgi:hypothetical protein